MKAALKWALWKQTRMLTLLQKSKPSISRQVAPLGLSHHRRSFSCVNRWNLHWSEGCASLRLVYRLISRVTQKNVEINYKTNWRLKGLLDCPEQRVWYMKRLIIELKMNAKKTNFSVLVLEWLSTLLRRKHGERDGGTGTIRPSPASAVFATSVLLRWDREIAALEVGVFGVKGYFFYSDRFFFTTLIKTLDISFTS